MAKNDPVPDAHSLARWIKPRFLAKNDEGDVDTDANGRPVFVFPQAFELREDEEYLSVTSLDLFDGERTEQLQRAAEAIQSSTEKNKLSKKSAIALGYSGQLKENCRSHGHNVRVLEEPVDQNIGHVAVRRYPRDVPELFELLSETCFSERYIFGDLVL